MEIKSEGTVKITSFRGKFSFLSNFYSTKIVYFGVTYNSVEHAYQAAKTRNRNYKEMIRKAVYPSDAKKLGRKAPLRSDWNDVKLKVMEDLIRIKFKNQILADRLLETGDIELVEENKWNDMFWGVCYGVGHNHLGEILMKVRAETKHARERKK